MPAKLYGQLVGAPIQTLQSGALLTSVAPLYKDSFDSVLWRDAVLTNGNLIGDTISLGTFAPTAFLSTLSSYIFFDAFGVGATLNIGDATHPSGLAAAVAIATANWGTMIAAPPAAQIAAPLWQRLGYAAPPGTPIELLASFAGANPANANFSWQIIGRNR